MDTQLDFSSISKFFLSVGVVFIFAGWGISLFTLNDANFSLTNNIVIAKLGMSIIFICIGIYYTTEGIHRLEKDSKVEESYKTEIKINNILDQDLKFMELKTKTLEYNIKIEEYNKNTKSNKPSIEHRNFETIAKQAMDPDYYNRTFGLNKVSRKK